MELQLQGKVVNASENQKGPNSQATVFVAVDTSGSMAGSKIQEVCNGLREIIAQCPPHVRFTVRKFDEVVQTVVTKTKYYLDVERLLSDLKICGSMTALYDGIGQTINEIPYNCSKLDVIHVLAFTDGCDNASKNYNLNSVIKLLYEKMTKGNIHFTFIQAGRESQVADALESSDLPRSKYNIVRVEDTVAGIKLGFWEAQKEIKMRFVVSIMSSSNSNRLPDGSAINSGLVGDGAVSIQVGSSFSSNSYKAQLPPTQKHYPKGTQNFPQKQLKYENSPTRNQYDKFPVQLGMTNPTQHLSRPFPNASNQGQLHQKEKYNHAKYQPEKLPVRQGRMNPTPDSSRPSATILNNFSVWVGNIPKTSSGKDVLKFFKQWGDCTLDTLSDMKECKCAIITYKSNDCADFAVEYGPLTTFFGSTINLKVTKT